jgi:hypothetical protein
MEGRRHTLRETALSSTGVLCLTAILDCIKR